MDFHYHGHSCFSVIMPGAGGASAKTRLLFDPFLTSNPRASITASKVKADVILVTHGHFDHIEDAALIAKRTKAKVLAAFEVGEWLKAQGVEAGQIQPLNHGGTVRLESSTAQMVNAVHSSSLPDGSYGGNPGGFVIRSAKAGAFYYSGDTALTMDMQLIPRKGALRFAVLSIGDSFTMGPDDALEAAKLLECDEIVGVHFDTWPPLKINHRAAKSLFAKAGKTLHLPSPGDTLRF
jgi:L-ascorbate metabolism protein UlaG (beta-lactamase superfamily)